MLYIRETSIIKIFCLLFLQSCFCFREIFSPSFDNTDKSIEKSSGGLLCLCLCHFYLFPHILLRILTNCLCRCDSGEPFADIFSDLSECVNKRNILSV